MMEIKIFDKLFGVTHVANATSSTSPKTPNVNILKKQEESLSVLDLKVLPLPFTPGLSVVKFANYGTGCWANAPIVLQRHCIQEFERKGIHTC